MPLRLSTFSRLASVALSLFLGLSITGRGQSRVTVRETGGQFQLLLNGRPFFIKGAGGTGHLQELKALGGNSIRTWGIESMTEKVDGKPLAARARELGLMITCGIWLQQQRDGFDYDNRQQVQAQRDTVLAAVRRFKDSPALLTWGLGNEMEGPTSDGSDIRVWKEVNLLAGIVKKEDPDHPVMTVIAGAGPIKIANLIKYCPNIDILGVNAYGSAPGLGPRLAGMGWKRPFVLTEFGPRGQWESPKTPWGAPVEPTSNAKADHYFTSQTNVTTTAGNTCMGSYAFLWGNKQEATSTWFGMFLADGERLPQADAMSKAWTGHWPAVRCPEITALASAVDQKTVAAGSPQTATVTAVDPGQRPLQYEWSVVDEQAAIGAGGDAEAVPPSHPECLAASQGASLHFTAPNQPGAYRLFLVVRNGAGCATTGNIPFQVQ